ncbi:hypothetical protein Bealeia1_00734 [Candidatus Bealeia paramacronuclearis]|uniref:Uncharacterized protein n=1 Tax=Candidatus Bealeia paramacronuclearis TaxID=1921001 RepID=A0ABZ2C542_9PROT|nr:hypothetical protein [Candidatus Bealeia paramacronuclearis]
MTKLITLTAALMVAGGVLSATSETSGGTGGTSTGYSSGVTGSSSSTTVGTASGTGTGFGPSTGHWTTTGSSDVGIKSGSSSAAGNVTTENGKTVTACENGRCPLHTSEKSLTADDKADYVPSSQATQEHAQ